MTYAIEVRNVEAELISAVRASARIQEIAQVWKPALDQVWAFLRTRPELGAGHNFFLYHHPANRSDPMQIEFGVQVSQRFEPEGAVACVETPAGEAAVTLHVGPYARLSEAHQAIHAWCAAHNRRIGGASWEIYGDWTEDPEQLETTIFYLLA